MKINDFLSVRLEKTNMVYTYVNNKRFLQCRHVILRIPTDKVEDYDGF